jgi:hypothetical protein
MLAALMRVIMPSDLGVKGQQFLRGGGHENCAPAAIGTAR